MFAVLVDRIDSPKSEDYGKWFVGITESHMKPFERVFIAEKKSDCVKYAKTLTEKPIVSSGRSHGAKW